MNANELNANNWPEFIPKEIIASGVYVITQNHTITMNMTCLLYTSPSPRDT